uniref:Uncharacterized protein n=1 Tax=Vespula pensylvanica TaxID=30213 RepID=A0A834U7R5_VESPE|nr:hypothetical protein H0235_010726 [Vespula pensylvanica]
MPANKSNQLSTPRKEKSNNGLAAGNSKKKKRSCVKHKKHCKQYLYEFQRMEDRVLRLEVAWTRAPKKRIEQM